MTKYNVTNPATGQVEKEFPELTDDQLTQAIAQASETFATWSKTSPQERATLLNTVADIYERRTDELVEIIGLKWGNPSNRPMENLVSSSIFIATSPKTYRPIGRMSLLSTTRASQHTCSTKR